MSARKFSKIYMPLECGHYVLSVPDCDPKWAQSNDQHLKMWPNLAQWAQITKKIPL